VKRELISVLVLLASASAGPLLALTPVEEIVRRSVENTNADWAAAAQYSFTERDVVTKHGKQSVKTFEVIMIEGSPYQKLIAIDDSKLARAQAEIEQKKLQQEIARRRKETAGDRQKRIEQYQKERRQDHALLMEMVKAFDFSLVGQKIMKGRRCFVLTATPKSSYEPKSRETKVLKSMRGEMWIDTEQYQWVKVHAEVFRPVAFGLFIANVKPGTEFTLEEVPVQKNIWLPSHFSTQVKASILMFSNQSADDETYSNYRPADETRAGK
jgi:hypothetical protein